MIDGLFYRFANVAVVVSFQYREIIIWHEFEEILYSY